MNFKKVLAILLALCMIIPMAACKKEDGSTNTTTTTAQADVTDGNGEADPTEDGEADPTEDGEADPTEDSEAEPTEGEAEPTGKGDEDTTTTTKKGDTTVTTKKTTTKKGDTTVTTKKTTTKKGDTTVTTKKTTTKKGDTTVTTKKTRTTTKRTVTTVSRPNISGYVGGEVTLKKGTVRADKGVDFGGAKFTLALGGTTTSDFTQGSFDAFREKYNGTITKDGLGSYDSTYTQKLAANMAGGKVYDVIFMYSPTYPAMFTADLALPVTDYITTADLWTNGKEGGFSEAVMQDYSWNGEAYAMGGNYSQALYAVFYNKKIFKDNRLEDPETLVAQGKWTWEKYLEIGQEYVSSNPGKYFMHALAGYTVGGFFETYDTGLVTKKDGVVKENTADRQLYKALEMLQNLHYGAGRIANTNNATDANSAKADFANGSIATFLNSTGWYEILADVVKGSSAFDKNTDNLGMVLAPKGGTSTNYGLLDSQAYLAGKGTSDVRAAICYARVESWYNTLNAYSDTTPAKYKKAICDALDSGKLKAPSGKFSSSLGELPTLALVQEVCKGNGVQTVLTTYKRQIQRIVEKACE